MWQQLVPDQPVPENFNEFTTTGYAFSRIMKGDRPQSVRESSLRQQALPNFGSIPFSAANWLVNRPHEHTPDEIQNDPLVMQALSTYVATPMWNQYALVNGSFKNGPISNSPEGKIPGWSNHEGGGDGVMAYSRGRRYLQLGKTPNFTTSSRTHNEFYVPATATNFVFSLRRTGATSDDVLNVYLDDVKLPEVFTISSLDANWGTKRVAIPAAARGKVHTLKFELSGGANGVINSLVDIDDVGMEPTSTSKARATIAPESANALKLGLASLADRTSDIEKSSGQTTPFMQPLPLVKASSQSNQVAEGQGLALADQLQADQAIQTSLVGPITSYLDNRNGAPTVEGLEALLKSLSIPLTNGYQVIVNPTSVTTSLSPDEVKFNLQFTVARTVNGTLDLGKNARDQRFLPTSDTPVLLSTGLILDMAFGVDLAEDIPAEDAFFIELNQFIASASINTTASLGVNVGFLAATSNDANFTFNGALTATASNVKDPAGNGQRITRKELMLIHCRV